MSDPAVTIKHPKRIIVHHSAGPRSQTTEQIRDYHKRVNGWSDIGYGWTIEADGVIRIGRPFPVIGAHARGLNSTSLGICLIGNNTEDGEKWNTAQVEALRRFVWAARLFWPELVVVGHGNAPGQQTACPGISEEILDALLLGGSMIQGS